ncbi:MAG: (2Fe-2S)-binding protein [SAR324 cluster bacterium]|nr:(2Fe-2S)-binding protein [SAR324 cluster bacterium]MCZ6842471.1 (2Fe-2S)-binding protein [SAR324 cluster bacterium]
MSKKRMVNATINGREQTLLCDNRMSLLDALRDAAGLTGTKEGCLTGDCGACSVVMNGKLVDSCLVMAAEAEGAAITTVEGLAIGSDLHALQQAFLSEAALQCGVCTPGFLVASKALLDRNPDPTEHEIRYWLAGNLCRCTGYQKILEAVQSAAAQLRDNPR